MNHIKFKDDFDLGFCGEDVVFQKLKTYLPDVQKTTYKFDKFDFRCNTTKTDLELKTRRIDYKQYPTIFFSIKKLREGREKRLNGLSNRTIYLFQFKNGDIYFWEDVGEDTDYHVTMCGNYKNGEKSKPLVNLRMDCMKPLSEFKTFEKDTF